MQFILLALLACATARGQEAAHLFGVLQSTPAHAAAGRAMGLQVALVSVNWDRFEPKPGVIDLRYAGEVQKTKRALRKLGYKLQLDLGVQYAPAWVFQLPNGRYQNQFGARFTGKEPGTDLPNVVFNAAVRERVGLYFAAVFKELGADWDYVRLGCSKYGELNYPQHVFGGHGNSYWAFDELAQGKTPGLPEGITPCPVPRWAPGTKSAQHQSARLFGQWYLDCLKNYQAWQIATVRLWYSGDVCMLYGSWGLRPGQLDAAIAGDLSGSTPWERNGELQQGYDWTRMIGAIGDSRVIVYCTWMDGTLNNRDICDDGSEDPARWSPAHWQSSLARSNPLGLRVWGENTGSNNKEAMHLTFERIARFGSIGVMWAFERDLYAAPNPGNYATAADLAESIRSAPWNPSLQ